MANFVFVSASGLIINRVVADDIGDCFPPEGVVAIAEAEPMAIGGTLVNDVLCAATSTPSTASQSFRNRSPIGSSFSNSPSKVVSPIRKPSDAVRPERIPSALQSFVDGPLLLTSSMRRCCSPARLSSNATIQ